MITINISNGLPHAAMLVEQKNKISRERDKNEKQEQQKRSFYLSFGAKSIKIDNLEEEEKKRYTQEDIIYNIFNANQTDLISPDLNQDTIDLTEDKLKIFQDYIDQKIFNFVVFYDDNNVEFPSEDEIEQGGVYLKKDSNNKQLNYKIKIKDIDRNPKIMEGKISFEKMQQKKFNAINERTITFDKYRDIWEPAVRKQLVIDYQYSGSSSYCKNQNKDNKYYGSYDRIRLPSKHDGFKHGLSEIASIKNMASYRKSSLQSSWGFFKNNCADAVFNVLQKSGANELGIEDNAKVLGLLRNPKVPVLLPNSSTLASYARQVRQKVLEKTVNDTELVAKEKINQVIDIEIMRLEDGVYNIRNNSLFRLGNHYLRRYEISNKEDKISALKEIKKALLSPVRSQTLEEQFSSLIKKYEETLKKGVFRRVTYQNLKNLTQVLLSDKKVENQEYLKTLSQPEIPCQPKKNADNDYIIPPGYAYEAPLHRFR